MRATLLGLPASHPALAAELMLAHKGVESRRIDLVPALSRPVLRALGFPRVTVPAVWLDGARVQGTREIALALDALLPRPALVPPAPPRRAAVMAAESWCDRVYQPVPRRVVTAALKRDGSRIGSYLAGAKLLLPMALATRTAGPFVAASRRLNRAYDEAIRRDLAALPGMVERVDALIGEGTIGGPDPNVADFQIGTTSALLMTLDDVAPLFEGRPAAEHARRVAPGYPGRMPPVFPREWLPAGLS